MSLYPGTTVEWHGARAYARCERCGKPVQLNKRLLGSAHLCATDCEVAGRHLDVAEEQRGRLWWKRTVLVCRRCLREDPAS